MLIKLDKLFVKFAKLQEKCYNLLIHKAIARKSKKYKAFQRTLLGEKEDVSIF